MAAIVPVVAATFAISTTAATIVVAAGQIALAVGLSYGAMLLAPQPRSTGSGRQDKPKVGTTVPRCLIFGRVATAGQVVHDNVYGTDKGRLQAVYALADHEISSVVSIVANDELKSISTVNEDGYVYAVGGFVADSRRRFLFNQRLGLSTQTADSQLVNQAQPSSRWTSNHRLRNIAYISALYRYHSKAHPTKTPPNCMWVIDGGKWYDPRKDSTVAGGSGAHRWDDKTTWEYSDNPYVCLYNYLRGYWVEGQLWVGAGLAADEIDISSFMTAASVSDSNVTFADGTTQKRYRIGMIVEGGRNADHRAVMDAVMLATAGIWTIRAGQLWVCAGADRAPVVTITDADLLPAAPLRMSSKRSAGQGLVNELHGTFTSPDHEWRTKDLPPIRDTTLISEDGQRLERSVDLSMVTNRRQALLLMRQIYRAARLQWNGEITVKPQLLGVEPGDVIRWTSARFGWTRDFIVMNWEDQDDELLSATWSLMETASTVWAPGGFTIPTAPIPVLPDAPADNATPQGFDPDPIRVAGEGGQELAGIKWTWTPPDDDDIDGVVFEYRKVGATDVLVERSDNAESGTYQTTKGLSLSATYESRASWFRSDRPKERAWTGWISVVSEGDTPDSPSAGPNRFENAGFRRSMVGWAVRSNTTALTATVQRNETVTKRLVGGNTGYVKLTGTPTSGTGFQVVSESRFGNGYSVAAGQKYEVSGLVGVVNCRARLCVRWLDSAGAVISTAVSATWITAPAGGTLVADYAQLFAEFTAPAGAATCAPGFIVEATSGADPTVYFTQPYFAATEGGRTSASRWAPGSFEEASLEDIDTGSVMLVGNIMIDGINGRIVGTDAT